MAPPLRTLMRLEARLLWRTRTPWLIATLFVVTSAAATANGIVERRRHHDAAIQAGQQQAEQHAAIFAELTRIEGHRAANSIPQTRLQPGLPSPAAVEARLADFRAALVPLPSAVVSAGTLQAAPQRYELRGGGGARFWPFGRTIGPRILSGFTPEQPLDNPSATIIGAFDLAFVVVNVYPLLILALSYNLVSADRETGLLALVGAQPIAFRRWVAARAIVRAGVVAIGVLPPMLAIALTIPVWSGDILLRLALWSLAVLTYCLVWLGLAIAISARTASASVSAVVAIVAWLSIVIVIPALVSVTGPLVAPASTRIAYATEERAVSLDVNPRVDAAIAALNQQLRTRLAGTKPAVDADHPMFTAPLAVQTGVDLLASLDSPPWSATMPAAHLSRALGVARRTLVEDRLEPILHVLDREERREARFHAGARYLSPALLVQSLIDAAAGTGQDRRMRFLEQLDEFVRQRDAFFTQRILENRNVTSNDRPALQPFHYREEDSTSWLPRMAWALMALLAMCICSLRIAATATGKWS